MLDLRTYSLKVHFKTISKSKVKQINNKLLYKAIYFIILKFYSFVYSFIKDIKHLLYQDLLFDKQYINTPLIPINTLQDNLSNSIPNQNFLQDPCNNYIFYTQDQLINHIALNKHYQAIFKLLGLKGKLNKFSIKTYINQVNFLLYKLLVLIYIIRGQPTRGTKILSIHYSNTITDKY